MPTRNPSDLDDRLDDYAAHGEALRVQPRKAWALYTAAAGAALAAAPAAEAAVSYSGLQNLNISIPGPSYGSSATAIDIDLNNDAVDDFRFRIRGSRQTFATTFPSSTFTSNYEFTARGTQLNGAFVGVGPLWNLPASFTIGSTNSFTNSGILHRSSDGAFDTGNFNTSGIVGARFLIGADTHYGWIRLQTGATGLGSGFLTVVDWAYETTPDAPISPGVVPEPSALSLLALGTAGLGLYRRKRTRLAAPEQREADAA